MHTLSHKSQTGKLNLTSISQHFISLTTEACIHLVHWINNTSMYFLLNQKMLSPLQKNYFKSVLLLLLPLTSE